ncbi:transaldolase [Citricoccus sp. I39-566]|uniref:transaldolase n=1 Tax=Citricoccus sp. I39-566 TaxID=3073268 RepID=UPI00286B0AD0|nr:transaldolase [Citricoccus sp. I39-566]WMY77310.1 transaldolase [Citricoccus sp. I39-566]
MTEQNPNTRALSEAGVSIWLDDLSRERIATGNLVELIETRSVTGVTTNPSIFAAALKNGRAYAEQLAHLVAEGADLDRAVFELTTRDVQAACDLLAPVYQATGGVDGRVSIEVDPRSARDATKTVAEAKALAKAVDRPNVLVKIPATEEGLPAITATLASGISVNVTLIFSLTRYREVLNAWLLGLEQAHAAGVDLSTLHSVASFFVSRVDSEVDRRLRESGAEGAAGLTGQAGLANARLAYRIFTETLDTERWRVLEAAGAHAQRPLWASTGTKDPALPDTAYVTGLVAAGTVNTMPEKTLEALADHGEVTGDTITAGYEEADRVLDAIGHAGVDYNDVVAALEAEGVEKFVTSWQELLQTVSTAMKDAS